MHKADKEVQLLMNQILAIFGRKEKAKEKWPRSGPRRSYQVAIKIGSRKAMISTLKIHNWRGLPEQQSYAAIQRIRRPFLRQQAA